MHQGLRVIKLEKSKALTSRMYGVSNRIMVYSRANQWHMRCGWMSWMSWMGWCRMKNRIYWCMHRGWFWGQMRRQCYCFNRCGHWNVSFYHWYLDYHKKNTKINRISCFKSKASKKIYATKKWSPCHPGYQRWKPHVSLACSSNSLLPLSKRKAQHLFKCYALWEWQAHPLADESN